MPDGALSRVWIRPKAGSGACRRRHDERAQASGRIARRLVANRGRKHRAWAQLRFGCACASCRIHPQCPVERRIQPIGHATCSPNSEIREDNW